MNFMSTAYVYKIEHFTPPKFEKKTTMILYHFIKNCKNVFIINEQWMASPFLKYH